MINFQFKKSLVITRIRKISNYLKKQSIHANNRMTKILNKSYSKMFKGAIANTLEKKAYKKKKASEKNQKS